MTPREKGFSDLDNHAARRFITAPRPLITERPRSMADLAAKYAKKYAA